MSQVTIAVDSSNGIVSIPSRHTVDQTVDKLQSLLQAKEVILFAIIDHSGEAAKASLKMPETKLLIFGSPKAGTPVMLAAPSIAIDLPLKVLVWEDGEGKTWLSWNSPEYLRDRHNVPEELVKNISVVEGLATAAGK